MDRDDLGKALKQIADEVWAAEQKPILVSELSVRLKRLSPDADYKGGLGKQSMKSFILDSAAEFGYQLFEHPTQRAKLGLAPASVQFAFPDEQKEERAAEVNTKGKGDGVALMRLLAKLPDADLEKISIPVSVLVKLFR